MQRLEVSVAVRPLQESLGVKGLKDVVAWDWLQLAVWPMAMQEAHNT